MQAHKNGSSGPPVVGFCFSFAVEQSALNSGKLLVWTKGFNVDNVIGKDVVQLLSGEHAQHRQHYTLTFSIAHPCSASAEMYSTVVCWRYGVTLQP